MFCVILISSLVKCLFIPFARFYWIVCYCCILRAHYIKIVATNPLSDIWLRCFFFLSLWIIFTTALSICHRAKVLHFDKDIYQSLILCHVYLMLCLRNYCLPQDTEIFSLCFLLVVLWFCVLHLHNSLFRVNFCIGLRFRSRLIFFMNNMFNLISVISS